MIDLEQLHDCYVSTSSKIVLLVVDGLGGLAHPDTGKSELETAITPNLDAMEVDLYYSMRKYWGNMRELVRAVLRFQGADAIAAERSSE